MPQNSAAAPAQPNDPQRSEEPAGSAHRQERPRERWWKRPRSIVAMGLAFLCVGCGLLAYFWPFSRAHVVQSIEEEFGGKLTIAKFQTLYFPHPGCVAEGLTLVHASSTPGSPPFAVARRFVLHAAYSDMFLRPGYVSSIAVEGLQVHIPARSQETQPTGQTRGAGSLGGQASDADQPSSNTHVGEFIADDAILEIARAGNKAPLRFDIHTLTLRSVSHKTSISYDAAFHNSLPPSEIRSAGHFGPWNSSAPAQTPVSGSYEVSNANLAAFDGISGMLWAHDNFRGVLKAIQTHGQADVPDFQVRPGIHKVHLRTEYQVVVDALNGDLQLSRITASVLQTTMVLSGSVAGRPGAHGKTTSLDLSVRQGRIQDVLLLVTTDPSPSFSGKTNFRAHVEVPPQGRPFIQEVNVIGDFAIEDGRFTNADTRKEIVDLSDRSSGKKASKRRPVLLDHDVTSKLSANVAMHNGVASLPNFTFSIPGAWAQLHGTYNLVNDHINFHGTLKTDASFSKTAGGLKSIFLKPFNVIFRRKPEGASIPIKLDGTYQDPRPGLDVGGGGSSGRTPQKNSGE
jgi:AsmA-like C-terminal region